MGQEMKDSYRELIIELKILFMRAEHKGEELAAERYRKAYQRLEIIRERRHLSLMEEERKDKKMYRLITEMLEECQNKGKTKEIIEDMIDNIESLCKAFNMKDEEETNEKAKDEGVER